jgi:hypothetical protein
MVDASLAYQPAGRGSCNGKPLRCSVKLRWLNRGMVWVKLRWLNTQGTRGGIWVGVMLTLAVKPQWVHYKLDETIEKPCSDLLVIHQMKFIFGTMEIF